MRLRDLRLISHRAMFLARVIVCTHDVVQAREVTEMPKIDNGSLRKPLVPEHLVRQVLIRMRAAE